MILYHSFCPAKPLLLPAPVAGWSPNTPSLPAVQIALFGRSLGGAVAIYLAASNPQAVKAVMIENTFTSIEEVAPKASMPESAGCTQTISSL